MTKVILEMQPVRLGAEEPDYRDLADYLRQCKQAAVLLSQNRASTLRVQLQVDQIVEFLKNAEAITTWIQLYRQEYFPGNWRLPQLKDPHPFRVAKGRFFHKYDIKAINKLFRVCSRGFRVLLPFPEFHRSTVTQEFYGRVCPNCYHRISNIRVTEVPPTVCPNCLEHVKFLPGTRVAITPTPNITKREYIALWPEVERNLREVFYKGRAKVRVKRSVAHVKRWQMKCMGGKSVSQILKEEIKLKDYRIFIQRYKKAHLDHDLGPIELREAYRRAIASACRRVRSGSSKK